MIPPSALDSHRSNLRRSVLTDPEFATTSTASPALPPPSPILTVNLPPSRSYAPTQTPSSAASAMSSSSNSTTSEHMAAIRAMSSHLTPSAAQHAQRRSGYPIPATLPASGTNRTAVIPRARRPSAPGSASTARDLRHATYSKPFPIPAYLLHSSYSKQFFTTPTAEPVFVSNPDATASSIPASPSKLDSGVLPPPSSLRNGADDASHDFAATLGEGLGTGGVGDLGGGVGSSKSTILLPTCWDEEDRCVLIELNSDGLGASFAGSGKYGDRDAAAVRANRPIPPQAAVYYFEVTITDKGKQGFIGIGLSHRDVSLSRLPGWEANSWGYHGDDGFSFASQGTGKPYGPVFGTGDVIGCGIDYTGVSVPIVKNDGTDHVKDDKGKEKEGGKCFFTKNGVFLGYAFQGLPGKLYPSVGLRTPGEIVQANFGSEPFAFDIDGLVRDRQSSIQNAVESTAIPLSLLLPPPSPPIPSLLPPSTSERTNETLQSLILSYLIHHGYSSTAQSFSDQLFQERHERATGLVPATTTSNGDVDMSNGDVLANGNEAMLSGMDSVHRGEIRNAFLKGEATKVIELVQKYYPSVLLCDDEEGGIEFKLKIRVFVETFRRSFRASELDKGKGKASESLPFDEDAPMDDLNDHFSTPPLSPSLGHSSTSRPPSPTNESTKDPLEDLIALGQEIHTEYSSDPRPAVQEALLLTFSLMAYGKPEESGGKIARLLSNEKREEVADELNSVILVSQSLPPMPQLESLWRHANASVRLLGDTGHGGAALLPYPYLSTPRPTRRW